LNEERCSQCGGDMIVNETKGVYICEYCGTEKPLPNEELQRIELEKTAKQKQLQDIQNKREYKKIVLAAGIIVIIFIAILIAVKIHNNNIFSVSNAQIYAKHDDNDESYYSKDNHYEWTYDQFYTTVTVRNATANTYLTFVWEQDDEIIFEDKIDISHTTEKTFTSALLEDAYPGFYTVDIYLNDNSTPIDSLYFRLYSIFD
jgi:DNA-directed RNA polymerase subunit M/transcription elongation factor TFIIS